MIFLDITYNQCLRTCLELSDTAPRINVSVALRAPQLLARISIGLSPGHRFPFVQARLAKNVGAAGVARILNKKRGCKQRG